MTYLAASGDDGAAACLDFGVAGLYVNMPASFPGVTGVGGTEFPTGSLTYSGGTATGYSAQEQVWMESDSNTDPTRAAVGSSIVFSRPAYQGTIPTCTMLGSLPVSGITAANMREVPDIALSAAVMNNGYYIECTYDTGTGDCMATSGTPTVLEIGGTSASTPSFAGVVALLVQATGGGRLGNINPLLYTLDSTTPTAFQRHHAFEQRDQVPNGNPGCPAGRLYGYAATTGYDCASGLGSIDANKLVTAWKALTPTTTALTAAPTATSEGATVDLTATVTVNGTNTHVLGGTVTFTFQSYFANAEPDLSWTLASGAITNGTTTTGSVSEPTVTDPPGLVIPADQAVDVIASYGGDATHLASTSPKVHITFSPLSFCVKPGNESIAGGQASPTRRKEEWPPTCGASCTTRPATRAALPARR